MEGQEPDAKATKRSRPTALIQQDFLFVESSEAKASRQGRRNARSFVMQKARRERPWSTSKQAAKQRVQGSTSPRSAGTSASLSAPTTASPSPTTESVRNGYFPALEYSNASTCARGVCSSCKIFVVRQGQAVCSKCILLAPAVPRGQPDSGIVDPFQASSVKITSDVAELLNHCKSVPLPACRTAAMRVE